MHDASQIMNVLRRRVRVALAREPGDLLLSDCRIVNVFTRQLQTANIVIADGFIAGVGPYQWQTRETLSLTGRTVMPGLIDSHMHLESTMLTPTELARMIVPHGATATISDSHEIGNVLGVAGIDMLITGSEGLPFDLFFTASSCVPATPWEDAGACIDAAGVTELLDRPRVLGLAEMMDFPGVFAGDAAVLGKIEAALVRRMPVDGHAPGIVGRELQAYAAVGIRSDHESEMIEEAREKAASGFLVQVREGSIARNLDTLLPLLVSGELGDDWTLVTDDVQPTDLNEHGHIDGLLRRIVQAGVPAADAVRHSTLIPARHYRLWDRGAVAPGYRADLVAVDDLVTFRPRVVVKDGRIVARDGAMVVDIPARPLSAVNTVHLAPIDEAAFRLKLRETSCPVIRIIPGKLMNRAEKMQVGRDAAGYWQHDNTRDVLLLASVERHKASGRVGLGFVSGFGLKRGAIGSSVAHDSHNLIIAGTNPRDMLACVRVLGETGGGFVAAAGGEVLARVPLPIAGLLSTQSGAVVCQQLGAIRAAAKSLGGSLPCPFGPLSFLALPVIPELRVTAKGYWDVVRQQFLQLS